MMNNERKHILEVLYSLVSKTNYILILFPVNQSCGSIELNFYWIKSTQMKMFESNKTKSECEWLLLSNSSVISSVLQKHVTFRFDNDVFTFVLDQYAYLDSIVITRWNNSPRINMSLHSDTLSGYPSQPVFVLTS